MGNSSACTEKQTILFLAANPKNSTPLRLDQEVREIDEGLTRAQQRDRFHLQQKWAVRPRDIRRAMLDLAPQIVHFSGHGVGQNGLAFEDDAGNAQLVNTAAIAGLFELFADQVECVVLNACYSEAQANAIVAHIPYVIGMNQAVGDRAAREFAVGFYDALGAGRDIEFAYKLACNSISWSDINQAHIPVLLTRETKPAAAPTVSADLPLESPEGRFSPDSRFYVASPLEPRCQQELVKPGSLIRIKSPRSMGKSTLMARVLAQAEQAGYRVVAIDLDQTNQKFFQDPDRFMQWFCASVGRPLGVRVKPSEDWDDIFGANDNSTDYFEKHLLTEDAPLVLAIDNFDRVFQYPDLETDLCGLLRGWHERSKIKPQWEKLRLIIVHSQEPYAQRDINQSPFNVGLPIELGEFTVAQVQDLVARHGLTWSTSEIQQVMALIGGHPYLVRSALYHIASGDCSLAEFLQTAATEAGLYSQYLREHLQTLETQPDLAAAMQTLVTAEQPVRLRAQAAFKLDSMGLVIRVDNDVKPRCLLYRDYFRDRLGGSS